MLTPVSDVSTMEAGVTEEHGASSVRGDPGALEQGAGEGLTPGPPAAPAHLSPGPQEWSACLVLLSCMQIEEVEMLYP